MILITFSLHYMLMLLVHVASVCPPCCMLLGVVTQSLKPVKLSTTCKRTQQVRTLSGQQSWELLRPFARSVIPKSDQHQFSTEHPTMLGAVGQQRCVRSPGAFKGLTS